MKITLFLVGTLAISSLWASVSQAVPAPGRKLPGPSAVQAARLKNSPPPGYLSHYLPDDRYKIAGGVWKYVSTELDTYYHIPSSPNMMRQPANRVIGFATARDAEEAGYVADPSDNIPSSPESRAAVIMGRTNEAVDYLTKVAAMFNKFGEEEKAIFKASQINWRTPEFAARTALVDSSKKYLKLLREELKEFDKLPYPPAAKSFNVAGRNLLTQAISAASLFNKGIEGNNADQVKRALVLLVQTDQSINKILKQAEKEFYQELVK